MKKLMLIVCICLMSLGSGFAQEMHKIPEEFRGRWQNYTKIRPGQRRLKYVRKVYCRVYPTYIQLGRKKMIVEDVSTVNNFTKFNSRSSRYSLWYYVSFKNVNEKWLFAENEYNPTMNLAVIFSTRTKREKYKLTFHVKGSTKVVRSTRDTQVESDPQNIKPN